VPGPQGLPIAGTYFEVYPDNLGNDQCLHDQYGPVFKTTDVGRIKYYTNDPTVANVYFGEGGFWSKKITKAILFTASTIQWPALSFRFR